MQLRRGWLKEGASNLEGRRSETCLSGAVSHAWGAIGRISVSRAHTLAYRELAEHCLARSPYIFTGDGVDDIVGRSAKQLGDDGKLVDVVLAREQRLALEHLGEDAAGAPDVDLDIVLLPGEHDLGGAVVSGRDVAGHLGVLDAGEAEVADLEIAVLVD